MIAPPQPAQNHKIVQVAYVVNDLQIAMRRWMESFGVGPFFVLDRPEVGEPLYRGAPQHVEFSAALAQAGDLHVELIEQHCDSPSCYRDLFKRGEEGFHHVAVIVDDYEREVARYAEAGYPVASSGVFGPLKFCYVDTSAATHGMVEVLEDLAFIRNYFARVRAASEGWDGERPIRDANELAG